MRTGPRHFSVLLRAMLCLVFLCAGIAKLVGPQAFADALAQLPVFRWSIVPIVVTLPWIEIAAAVLLVTKWYRLGALLAIYLAAIFVFVLAIAVFQGHAVQCGCFGLFSGTSIPWALARATLLFLVSLYSYLAWILNSNGSRMVRSTGASKTSLGVFGHRHESKRNLFTDK